MPDFLPDLPVDRITACFARSPGHEMRHGKFDSPESSAALSANGFGWFMERPGLLPMLPGVFGWPARSVTLEAEMRFPWAGGRHPWLDVMILTDSTLVGVESKRYEPFRPGKAEGFSEAYDARVWGEEMERHRSLRLALQAGSERFQALDAVQLVKHGYGLRTQGLKRAMRAVLVYLYAEPEGWASGKRVDPARIALHRAEIARYADLIRGDEVAFVPLCWGDVLRQWAAVPALQPHVAAMRERFGVLG